MSRDIVMRRFAFCWTESIGIPKLFYAATLDVAERTVDSGGSIKANRAGIS
jgi:hypothetical protein